MKRIMSVVEAVSTVSVTVASIAVLWIVVSGRSLTTRPPSVNTPSVIPSMSKKLPLEDISHQNLHTGMADSTVLTRGSAKVALVEFSDFECPFCGKYTRETRATLQRDFVDTGKVAYVFRNFPLENIHHSALKAAEAAECARRQGRFWQMHDLLFGNQKALAEADLLSNGLALQLDETVFRACLNDKATATIQGDEKEGTRLGVSSTPTFFLGTIESGGTILLRSKIRGAQPYEIFKKAILDVL